MANETKGKKTSSETAGAGAVTTKHYLIQQGREMFVLESATYPDLSVEPGEKIKKVLGGHEKREKIDKLIARQVAEAKLSLRP